MRLQRPGRMRRFGVGAVLVAILLAWAATPSSAAGALLKLSSDPFKNPSSQHKTEVEADTFAYGSVEVGTFQTGRFFNGGSSDIGWATSTDGGATWSHGFLPGITVYAGGTYDRASDPSVAYDAEHGVWLISVLGLITDGFPFPIHTDVLVSRSTDGLNWQNAIPVHIGNAQSFLDKNWTTCDNHPGSSFYGHCYTEFDNAANRDLIQMTTSTDGGLTWSNPVPTADHASGLGGQPVVQPDGTVIDPILRFPRNAPPDIGSFVSTDGGTSWSATTQVASIDVFAEPVNLRNPVLPSAAVDAGGRVYTAWQDCRFEPGCSANDIVVSTSTDGLTWTAPERVPIDPVGSGADQFTPGIDADPTTSGSGAHLGITYYSFDDATCTLATCRLQVGFISSTDGGADWGAATHVAGPMNVPWLPETTQGYMYGDYVSTSFIGGSAYPVFAVARAPGHGPRPRDVPMFTVAGGLATLGGATPAGHDVVGSSPMAVPSVLPTSN